MPLPPPPTKKHAPSQTGGVRVREGPRPNLAEVVVFRQQGNLSLLVPLHHLPGYA